jgi:pimeloyl-ACP methyl ester carboxylesterase
MAYFHRPEADFYFEEHGRGTALVYSHGLGGSLDQVREDIGELPGVRLIFYDNRGHGRTSTRPDAIKPSFSRMAADLEALLDELGLGAAVIGGVSMGAGIALSFGRHYKARAKALILIRPAWLNSPNPPNLSIISSIADRVERHGRERGLQLFENSEIYSSLEAAFPATARSLVETFSSPGIEARIPAIRSILASAPFHSIEDLQEIAVPTLVLGNQDDPIHPFEYAQRLAVSIPSAQLCKIPSKSENLQQHERGFGVPLPNS